MKIYNLNVMFATSDETQTQSQPYTTKEKAMEALKEAVRKLKKDERIDKKLAMHNNDEDDVWLHDDDDNWFGDFSIHIFIRECETDMPFEPNLE